MSFLKGVKDEVLVNVRVEVTGDLGKKIIVPFKARYKRLPINEAKVLVDNVRADIMTDEQLIQEVLLGWQDMPGPTGEDVKFSQEALDEAMSVMGYRKALVEGFINQQFEIETKNR